MQLKYILIVISILLYFQWIYGTTLLQIKTLFDVHPCNISCGGLTPHTICFDIENKTCGSGFITFFVEELYSINFRARLILGHNGLRNRIATRMGVANMIGLAWADELEEISRNFFYYCKPFQDDKFAHCDDPLDFKRLFEQFSSGDDGYKYVAQNRFCVKSDYFPKDFVEMAMRSWYFDKNDLSAPTFRFDDKLQKKIGILLGENNFTHLAYPLTFRFGCAVARNFGYFCVTCFYYPFYRASKDSMEFVTGEPASYCPAYFPLKDEYYRSLCTGGHEDERLASTRLDLDVEMFFLTIFLFFF